jgi:hypothetical protein
VKISKIFIKDHPEGDLVDGYFGKPVKDSSMSKKLDRLADIVEIY